MLAEHRRAPRGRRRGAAQPGERPDELKVTVQAMYAFIDAKTRNRDKIRASLEAEAAAAEADRARVEKDKAREAKRLALLEKLAGQEVVVERHSRWVALVIVFPAGGAAGAGAGAVGVAGVDGVAGEGNDVAWACPAVMIWFNSLKG